MKSYKGVSDNKTIGVITPFRAQCSKIYEEMNPDYRSLVNVDTVERFQGSEREIIIISFAINHVFLLKHIQSLAFSDGIAIDRKLNVALTRSRQQLIMLGVREILIASPIFSDMLKYINVLGKIIHKDNAKKIFK
jgi:superfamily I DNA and/or RNA helicase